MIRTSFIYLPFIIENLFTLFFILLLTNRKKIAWICLIVAYVAPLIREFINIGSSAVPEGYNTYAITINILYLCIAIFGYVMFEKTVDTINGSENRKYAYFRDAIFILLVIFIVYSILGLVDFDFTKANFEANATLSSLFVANDIVCMYGLVLAALLYRVSFLFLAIGSLLLVTINLDEAKIIPSDATFLHFYTLFCVICVILLLRGYFLNKQWNFRTDSY